MTGLLCSAKKNQPHELLSILEFHEQRGVSLDLEEVHRALVCATQAGSLECVRHLLTVKGVNPSHRDGGGNPLLCVAVKDNHPGLTLLLCQAGANVEAVGSGNCTPLHLAARHGRDDCLEVLLQFGCDPDARDSTGSTALILAVRWKQYLAISLLLEHGCDVNARDHEGRTALHYGSLTAVAVDRLINAGADVNARDNEECTPLLMAACEGLDGVVSRLCETPGIDVNIPNRGIARTPLHILAQKGHARSVYRLLMTGADSNLLDGQGRSPLYYAVARARCDVTATLLKANGRVDSYQCPTHLPAEDCPVHLAAEQSLTTILKLFILSGYDNCHVRQAVAQPHIQALFEGEMIQHWLDHAHDVPSLRHLCRMWLRHHLGSWLLSDLSKLRQLPDKLRDYISMAELDDVLST